MNPTNIKASRKKAFTIVELLTIMSIIVILISLLVPAFARVKRYARKVKQKAQFHSIEVAMDLFNAEHDGYPPSNAIDSDGNPYCGAMKLAEAMVGQDQKGFHPASRFRADGTIDGTIATSLYPAYSFPPTISYAENLKARKGPYVGLENANPRSLSDIYIGYPQTNYNLVLCDVYRRTMLTGEKVGMPILYYKANLAGIKHDPNNYASLGDTDYNTDIYHYEDNDELVQLGLPWDPTGTLVHPMDSSGLLTSTGDISSAKVFYENTENKMIGKMPYRADSYILLSAGFDGEYGTSDDVFNFAN